MTIFGTTEGEGAVLVDSLSALWERMQRAEVTRWFENAILNTLTPVSRDWRRAHKYETGKGGHIL